MSKSLWDTHDGSPMRDRPVGNFELPEKPPIAPCPGTGGAHVPYDYIDGVQTCCHCEAVIDRERPLDRVAP